MRNPDYGTRVRALAVVLRCACGLFGLLIALHLLTFGVPAHAQEARKNVLILWSLHSSLPAFADVARGLTRELTSDPGQEVEIFSEYLDADRFATPEQQEVTHRYIRERYADRPVDVVIVIGPQAFEYVRASGDEMFPGVPVVYAGLREERLRLAPPPPNYVGIASRLDVADTARLALALQPGARELVIVTGASEFDRTWETMARSDLTRLPGKPDVRYVSGLPIDDLIRELAALTRDTVVIYLSVLADGSGRRFVSRVVLARIAPTAGAPIYSVYDSYVGVGIVGGYMDTFEGVGTETGRIARRILNGEEPARIAMETHPISAYIVDWRQLERWGLDTAKLPAGTEIRNQPPSLWDQHRDLVMAAIAVVIIQGALIATLLVERRYRRRVGDRLRESERQLRESEELYRNVVETQSELICRYLPDTTLTFVNDAYCRYFGRSRAELLGSRFLDLVPEAARPVVLDRVRSLTEQPSTQSYEHEVLRPDGAVGWQQWKDHSVLDETGRIAEIQAVGRDLTDLRKAEEEARARREEVTHLTRVASLGELSGALAHELNQPLTAILSNAEAARRLLDRDKPDIAELRAILGDIIADDNRAGEVIQRLRALLKRGSAQFGPLDLNQVATEVLELSHSELVERGVAVRTCLAPGLPRVLGDRIQLQQVLLNLILNSCEAIDSLKGSDRTLTIATSNGDGLVEATVSDCGIGIEPALLERMFEPFVTTKNGGLGLGLSICRTIVNAHGGSIWACSNPDRGATIGFAIPASRSEAQ